MRAVVWRPGPARLVQLLRPAPAGRHRTPAVLMPPAQFYSSLIDYWITARGDRWVQAMHCASVMIGGLWRRRRRRRRRNSDRDRGRDSNARVDMVTTTTVEAIRPAGPYDSPFADPSTSPRPARRRRSPVGRYPGRTSGPCRPGWREADLSGDRLGAALLLLSAAGLRPSWPTAPALR